MTSCQCSDPKCPACSGKCVAPSTLTLYRIDMKDVTGTPFCELCASDALDSGVYCTHDDYGEDDSPEQEDET